MEIKNEKLKKLVEKARIDFFTFCIVVTREDGLSPFADFQELICNRIQHQLTNCHTGIREMFSVPPGHGKSTLLSQLLVAYLLGIDPKNKIILISYGADLSKRNARLAKKIMEKPIYRLIFPDTAFEGERDNPPFDTTAGGGIRASGREGQITGFRANYILIDDILKGPAEAASETIINGIHNWFPTVANSRLSPNAGFIILATRWTKKDLIGWLSEKSSKWNYINIEAICTDKEKDPIHREVGEALWPDYISLDILLEAQELNKRAFEVVYQGNCTAAENTPIDIKRVRYVQKVPFDSSYKVISYDTASKINIENDWTVASIWEVSKDFKQATLIDIDRRKVEFPELLRMHDDLETLYSPDLTIVEDKNSGVQLIQMRKRPQLLPSKDIKAEEKIGFADLFNIFITSGDIRFRDYLREKKEELKDLDEFPFGSNDDVALSVLHFIKWFVSEDKEKTIIKKVNAQTLKAIMGRVKSKNKARAKTNFLASPRRGVGFS